ncbi:hypothetical protein N8I77_002898 [Diaporthe amygdali]|uniref:Integral membrane protein n=1 Tax=Phomopsis amygdali TaxID=1214568 RepID=A0AAD9W749_PHOAM|nr:hypothetical protein N8I77_002898 [Diaporthe amygdali]
MGLIGATATAAVAGLHGYILVLQMFLWDKKPGMRAFRLTPQYAAQTKVLASNQGLYNGFLAAGLAWGLAHPVPEFATQIRLFFLGCVGVAGVYGALTANKKILFIQGVPAAVAAGLVLSGL